MKLLLALPLLLLSGLAYASDMAIPLNELGFLDRIGKLDKAAIVAQIGEPSLAMDLVQEETGEIAASIWHYHYLNTSETGEYYKTTELNFIDGRVVNVVFSMTDDGESSEPSTASDYLPIACTTDC